MADYPTSAKTFTTKATNDTIEAAHVNDMQDEITAIESALLTALQHNLLFTDDTYDIGQSGATRPRDLFLSRNAVIGGTLAVAGAVTLTADLTVGDQLVVSGTGAHAIGVAASTRFQLRLGGSYSPSGGSALDGGLVIDSALTPQVDASAALLYIGGSFTEAASGTHALLAAARFVAPTINAAGAAVTAAATVYIDGAPSGGTTNYALRVAAGEASFAGNVSIPFWAFNAAGGFLEGAETGDPSAPSANNGRIYFRDTGGKTELVVRFATGAIQQIAIEP